MSLSRKRRKELKRLQSSAEELWGNQQHVLEHANAVAREASRQLGHITREEVVPRVRTGYESFVRPGFDQARHVARSTGEAVEHKVVPAIGNALGAVMSIGDVANDARVRRAVARIAPRTIAPQKKGPGVGTYLAIGAGIIAAAGVAYAVWQTFRADDELWVADDEPSVGAADDI